MGVGGGMEPNLFEGGGVASFYGQNLRNNIGFWPRYKTCKDYPEVTVVTAPATCEVNGYTWCGPSVASSSTPSMRPAPLAGRRTPTTSTRVPAVSGVFTPAVTESETTRTCANDNGRCCNHYNKREDSHRTTLIILLKTPYAIGTIAALFLHLLLPEDRVLDEEKEHYPRAFSDGEIAYETRMPRSCCTRRRC